MCSRVHFEVKQLLVKRSLKDYQYIQTRHNYNQILNMSKTTQNTFKDSYVPLYQVSGITLSVLNSEEVVQQSVTNITDDGTYTDSGDPIKQGINDDLMGTMDTDRLCKTCMGDQTDCPGHFGHIALAKPVFHGNLIVFIMKVLRIVCFNCSHLMPDQKGDIGDKLEQYQKIKNAKSRFTSVFKLGDGIKECQMCQKMNHKYTKGPLRIDYEILDPSTVRPGNDPKQTMWPEEAQRILSNISAEHLKKMGLDKVGANPANMIIENLAVAPPPVRPSVQMTNNSRSEDDLTIAYRQIIKQNNEIKRAEQAGNTVSSLNDLRTTLQFFVSTVMDNDISSVKQKHQTGKPIKSIRARLKGKEGRLRGNLMGKRVDFSARTVITPDPNLRLDQLGVPIEIAMNLTKPEVVTEHNHARLRKLVDRGANNWPGAKYIKRTDGHYVDLAMLPNRTDQHLEIGYTVERHLMDNDYVIFNRQPSLHKMSLMGHRVKVLPFQTFRLNLSVTTPYNADFDGDEMNMHVPQSLETHAEIKEIMAVPRQIVAPQSNKPCMGIVQDSLLGIFRFTQRETFIDKAAVMNLLMWVNYDLEQGIPPPAIIKPKPLWSGKQIMSLVIPKSVNFETLGDKGTYASAKDGNVIIQAGELLAGILRKGNVGNAAGGLIHIVWKDLGPQACCDLLSNIQLCVNNWLVNSSFTVGVNDIIPKVEISNQVKEAVIDCKRKVAKVIKNAQYAKLKTQPGKSLMESFEFAVNSELNEARKVAGNKALESLQSDNRLKNMVNAGSKGSDMNISQIMACVGQQNVEGKRIPFGFARRTLPHFTKDDFGPESKGFVENSYLTGLTPSEFYFHAMGGREGLIDTAVKTADTGYISRRLMKAMEDIMVKYDGTVRTSREMLVQFLYGEDGMAGEHFEACPFDLAKLNNAQLDSKCNFLSEIKQPDVLFRKLSGSVGQAAAKEIVEERHIRDLFVNEFRQLEDDRETLRTVVYDKVVMDRFISPVNVDRLVTNIKQSFGIRTDSLCDIDPVYYFDQIDKMLQRLVVIPQARLGVDRDPGIKESHDNSMMLFKIFLRRNLCAKRIMLGDRLNTPAFNQLIRSIEEVFRGGIVNPGEMVGSIGAQSMGEPATQMTLNTFHSAGISSKNVTLGVPRLKEIINVAKTIKTPSLKVFLKPEIARNEEEVMRISQAIQYCNLSHLIKEWGIYYDPDHTKTIIEADSALIGIWHEMNQDKFQEEMQDKTLGRWVLRILIDPDPTNMTIFDESFQFRRDIGDKIERVLNAGGQNFQVIYSEDTDDQLVIRIRLFDFTDEEDQTTALRELADQVLNAITLRGFEEISKVSSTSTAQDCETFHYDPETGAHKQVKGNFLLETDGVALAQVLNVEGVDATKTTSNSVLEVLSVLGIEAARNALIAELRSVHGAYDIYVNYRHLAALVDFMTQRGILTAIMRHGINRVNSGPLRKCSFEETTEILLEAAFYGEFDGLSGITENIIFGQMAPYGTGAFDLVVDRNALINCIEDRMGGFQPYPLSSEHTPMVHEGDQLTPTIMNTPNAYMTNYGGGTSVYDVGTDGGAAFTPAPYQAMMSPGYDSTMTDQARQSPSHAYAASNSTGKTPVYGSTPVYGYGSTPGNVAAAYSPAYGGGAGSAYSPANVMPYQSPSYSPTTPNYGASGMAPVATSTPTYNYGAPSSTGPTAYQMPNVCSPSYSPAATSSPQVTSGPAAMAYSQPSPSYGVALAGGAGVAYNPEATGRNSDSSDSEEDK